MRELSNKRTTSRVPPQNDDSATQKKKSHLYYISFTAPQISILSDSAKHVEHRSALNLTCVVNAVASEAQSGGQKWPKMVWYKDGKVCSSFIILLYW